MKVRKGDHVVEIQPMNQTIWEGRGYVLVAEGKPKKGKAQSVKAGQAELVTETEAVEGGENDIAPKPKRKSRKRSRKPKPGPSD